MNQSTESTAWQMALEPQVVRRAAIMAIVVGTVLVAINHGICLWNGHFGWTCLTQSSLTYLVPYAVSTVSSVQAIKCRACGTAGKPTA